eukprot:CCRYP_020871-RA/>CCRYP_020871-RA protein AED:0.34 eAED:0.32 QI:0/0/0/1/1/1/2/0/475
MCNGVVHPITKETITKYEKLANDPILQTVWKKAMCKELGRLAQGWDGRRGTDTIFFMSHDEIKQIPRDQTVTYARIVVNYRPQKDDPNRVRITVGGNLINYPGELTTRTADLTTAKILWNSTICTPGARFACADIENMYLQTPMDSYVQKQLIKYNHPKPKKPVHTPWEPYPIKYGSPVQQTLPNKDSPPLNAQQIKHIQQVIGSFLYYSRATDPTISHALSELATQQAHATENTLKRCDHFLDYMATHQDAQICYYTSDMVLNIHSDASYLSIRDTKSRAAGIFFLGSIPINKEPIKLNGAIAVLCTILKFVASSAAEAELGALFLNAKEANIMQLTLQELGHPQPPTPVHCDNSTTIGIVTNTVKRQKSRSMEMRYFWLLENHANKLFDFQHHPGLENLADYPSKAHPGGHHLTLRPLYVNMPTSPCFLSRTAKPSVRRGCADKVGGTKVRKYPLPTLTRVPRGADHMPAAAA